MRIAIVGAGFCGLAVAWNLVTNLHIHEKKIHIFDPKPIGSGTSGISAGLLHPYVGAHANDNWRGHEGLEATMQLLKVAEDAMKTSVIGQNQGILRLALNAEQIHNFKLCAQRHPDTTAWLSPEETQLLAPLCHYAPGLLIKNGYSVFPALYLQGLWRACQSNNVHLLMRAIDTLEELNDFDLIVVTAGAETIKIKELTKLPLNQVKGQVLRLHWPAHVQPLNVALNAQSYLVMDKNIHTCIAGATYEREYNTPYADIHTAKKLILPKIYNVYPALYNTDVLDCSAGLRAVAPKHLPLIVRLSSKQWILTGMGSKGLLYHALMAKELVKSIISEYGFSKIIK